MKRTVSTTARRPHRFARCPECHRPTRETLDGHLFKHYRYDGSGDNHCPGSGTAVVRYSGRTVSAVVRFLPTDDIPPALANDIAVSAVPRIGESVYLQGIYYRVADVAHFFNQTARTGQDEILISLERAK